MRSHNYHIGYKGAQTLYYAGEQAERIGLPLNNWVTINFASTAVAPWDASAVFQKYRNNYYSKWARRLKMGRAFAPTWAYVFENERDGVPFMEIGPGLPHNVHVHWRVHVPPALQFDFECLAEEWLDAVAGSPSAPGAIKIAVVGSNKKDAIYVRSYTVKGSPPAVAGHFGAKHQCAPQGKIIGQRSRASDNIGPSARRNLDWQMGINRRSRLAA